MRQSAWLRLAAFGTWAVCGLPAVAAIVRGSSSTAIAISWAAAFIAYGLALAAAFWVRARAKRFAIAFAAVQSLAAVTLASITGVSLDGTGVGLLAGIGLMVVVAAQLPHLVGPKTNACWIAGQTLAMTGLIAGTVGLADLVTFGLGAAGFQMFASLTTALMLRESAARTALARANADLHATRALLAESSRTAERLRIARDLHDTLGHHLTALSLQLDVASRMSDGAAAAHVQQAHAVTRLLLAEVRSVVGEMRERGDGDLARAIRAIAQSTDAMEIHLDIPDRLTIEDSAQAQSLVRCIQEIVTNASRHASARHLWISIDRGADGIELHARDDGRGTDVVECGNGLTGMRERFAEYSGRVEFGGGAGRGFEVHGFMPTAQAAP